MSGCDDVWLVESGRIDLFLIQGDDGEHAERTRIYSVEAGHAVFCQQGVVGQRLLGVGTPGTVAYRLERNGLAEMETSSLAALVDTHLDNVTAAMARDIEVIPEAEVTLSIGEPLEAAQLSVARSEESVWIRQAEGASLYMGMEDVGENSAWYPVTPHGWIQPLRDVTMEFRTTAEMVQDDEFWTVFDLFQATAMRCLSLGAAFASADRLVALREKAATDIRVTRGGLLKLASIMDSSIEAPSAHDSSDALATACAMVARHIGVDVSSLDGPLNGTTVEEVAESGSMRSRRVLLRGDWFQEDGGPLVAFMEADKRPVALIPISPTSYSLHDPKDDSIRSVTKDTQDELEPAAYSLYRPLPATKLTMRDIPVFGLRGSWKDLSWVGILGAVLGVAGLVTPMLTRTIFNDIIPGADRGRLLQVVAILLGFTLASLLFEVTKSIAMLRAKARTEHNLETAIWERLLRLPVNFFDDTLRVILLNGRTHSIRFSK